MSGGVLCMTLEIVLEGGGIIGVVAVAAMVVTGSTVFLRLQP